MAEQKISDLLQTGGMSLMRLVSEAGLPPEMVMEAVQELLARGEVTSRDGRLDYPNRLAARYEAVRAAAPSHERTDLQERLMLDARAIARRRGLTATDRQALWASRQLGQRILALAGIYEERGATSIEIVLNGIAESMSAFEQFHAMMLALRDVGKMSRDERATLGRLLEDPSVTRWFASDSDRMTIAVRIREELAEHGQGAMREFG